MRRVAVNDLQVRCERIIHLPALLVNRRDQKMRVDSGSADPRPAHDVVQRLERLIEQSRITLRLREGEFLRDP